MNNDYTHVGFSTHKYTVENVSELTRVSYFLAHSSKNK